MTYTASKIDRPAFQRIRMRVIHNGMRGTSTVIVEAFANKDGTGRILSSHSEEVDISARDRISSFDPEQCEQAMNALDRVRCDLLMP